MRDQNDRQNRLPPIEYDRATLNKRQANYKAVAKLNFDGWQGGRLPPPVYVLRALAKLVGRENLSKVIRTVAQNQIDRYVSVEFKTESYMAQYLNQPLQVWDNINKRLFSTVFVHLHKELTVLKLLGIYGETEQAKIEAPFNTPKSVCQKSIRQYYHSEFKDIANGCVLIFLMHDRDMTLPRSVTIEALPGQFEVFECLYAGKKSTRPLDIVLAEIEADAPAPLMNPTPAPASATVSIAPAQASAAETMVSKKPFNPVFVGAKTQETEVNPGHGIIIDGIVNDIMVNLLNELPKSPKRSAPDNPPHEEETLEMPLDNQPEERSYEAINAKIDQLPQFSSANFREIEPEKTVFSASSPAKKQQSQPDEIWVDSMIGEEKKLNLIKSPLENQIAGIEVEGQGEAFSPIITRKERNEKLKNVVIIGDSHALHWQKGIFLGRNFQAKMKAVSGDTASDMNKKLASGEVKIPEKNENVIISIGTNDAKMARNDTINELCESIIKIRVQAPSAKISLMNILPRRIKTHVEYDRLPPSKKVKEEEIGDRFELKRQVLKLEFFNLFKSKIIDNLISVDIDPKRPDLFFKHGSKGVDMYHLSDKANDENILPAIKRTLLGQA